MFNKSNTEYQLFLKVLDYSEGFNLYFVDCSPAVGTVLVEQVRLKILDKKIQFLKLNQPTNNLYGQILRFPDLDQTDILFISGLESSFYEYEERYQNNYEERYRYSKKGVPPILVNLNQQRENLRDQTSTCFVFLIPAFIFKYFILRAPDFFDWRSGVSTFPCGNLATRPATEWLHPISTDEEGKLIKYCKAIDSNPKDCNNFFEKGNALFQLGRYQESVDAYSQAIALNPDFAQAWYFQADALFNLQQYEQSVKNYDKAMLICSNVRS